MMAKKKIKQTELITSMIYFNLFEEAQYLNGYL